MQIDEELLQGVDRPLLRFYDWSSCAITYGYFINPDDWLNLETHPNVARRPTGGGLIFHEGDFSFTLALPLFHPLTKMPALERYKIINNHVLLAIGSLLSDRVCALQNEKLQEGVIKDLCMANPTVYDIMLSDKKVGGAAQRKNRRAFIHQCSLFLQTPSWDRISLELIDPIKVLPMLKAHTGSLFSAKDSIPSGFRSSLKIALQDFMHKVL